MNGVRCNRSFNRGEMSWGVGVGLEVRDGWGFWSKDWALDLAPDPCDGALNHKKGFVGQGAGKRDECGRVSEQHSLNCVGLLLALLSQCPMYLLCVPSHSLPGVDPPHPHPCPFPFCSDPGPARKWFSLAQQKGFLEGGCNSLFPARWIGWARGEEYVENEA